MPQLSARAPIPSVLASTPARVSVRGVGSRSMLILRSIFASPPREYSTGPLWVWNDRLTEDQIRSTLRDLAGQNVRQAWGSRSTSTTRRPARARAAPRTPVSTTRPMVGPRPSRAPAMAS